MGPLVGVVGQNQVFNQNYQNYQNDGQSNYNTYRQNGMQNGMQSGMQSMMQNGMQNGIQNYDNIKQDDLQNGMGQSRNNRQSFGEPEIAANEFQSMKHSRQRAMSFCQPKQIKKRLQSNAVETPEKPRQQRGFYRKREKKVFSEYLLKKYGGEERLIEMLKQDKVPKFIQKYKIQGETGEAVYDENDNDIKEEISQMPTKPLLMASQNSQDKKPKLTCYNIFWKEQIYLTKMSGQKQNFTSRKEEVSFYGMMWKEMTDQQKDTYRQAAKDILEDKYTFQWFMETKHSSKFKHVENTDKDAEIEDEPMPLENGIEIQEQIGLENSDKLMQNLTLQANQESKISVHDKSSSHTEQERQISQTSDLIATNSEIAPNSPQQVPIEENILSLK